MAPAGPFIRSSIPARVFIWTLLRLALVREETSEIDPPALVITRSVAGLALSALVWVWALIPLVYGYCAVFGGV